MKQQLFKPFRMGQWLRLAVTGLLAGEMSSAGGCNLQFPFNLPSRPRQSFQLPAPGQLGFSAILAIALLVFFALIFFVAMVYVSSRMRFVLFDSIVAGECRIGEFWSRRGEPGYRYFVFQILFFICSLVGFGILLGIPLLMMFSLGWLRSPREHLFPLVLFGALFIAVFLIAVIFIAVIQVLTKDFVVPQMALDNLTASEGWRRLWPMMKEQQGKYAVYLGLKLALAIAAMVLVGIASLMCLLIILVSVGGVGAAIFFLARNAGVTWNVVTISFVVAVCLVLLVFLILMLALISVPAIVFFPAYSMHFFADRYPPLRVLLFPPL